MKILLVGSFLHPMYAPAFKIGFKKMGHDVRCIKYEDYLYGGGLVGNFFTRLQNRYHLGYKVWKYNLDIINAVHAYHPDLVFLYRCHNVWGSTAKKIKSKNIILFTYHNDDPFSGIPS